MGVMNEPIAWFERELLMVCYHEAGHAVASCVLGIRFKYVSVVPGKSGRGKGRIKLYPLKNNPPWETIDREGVLTQAGPAAQACWVRYLLGGRGPYEDRDPSRWLECLV